MGESRWLMFFWVYCVRVDRFLRDVLIDSRDWKTKTIGVVCVCELASVTLATSPRDYTRIWLFDIYVYL